MAISTFLDPSQMPARTMDQQTFDALMAAVMQRLPTWGAEVNATASSMNVSAFGSPYAIPYILAASNQAVGTAAGGKFANDGSTFYFDAKDMRGVSVLAILALFGASTSNVKGTFKVTAQNDPTRWVIYDMTSYAQGSTGLYGSASVVFRGGSAGGTNYPLIVNEPVLISFQRSGDKGDIGSFPFAAFRDQRASGAVADSLAVGWNTRTFNTTMWNTAGISLSGNQLTIPIGAWWIEATAPVSASGIMYHQARLYNVTGGSVLDYGTSESSASTNNSRSLLKTYLVVTGQPMVTRLDHYVSIANRGGIAASSGGLEIFSEIKFQKVG